MFFFIIVMYSPNHVLFYIALNIFIISIIIILNSHSYKESLIVLKKISHFTAILYKGIYVGNRRSKRIYLAMKNIFIWMTLLILFHTIIRTLNSKNMPIVRQIEILLSQTTYWYLLLVFIINYVIQK